MSGIYFSEAGVAACRLPHSLSFAFRPGSFFVHRMLTSVGMPRIAACAEYVCRMVNPGRRVALGPEFREDLEFWRWFVSEGLDAQRGTLSAPMYHLLERPAQRTLFSDASKTAIEALCLATGVYRRFDLNVEEQSRGRRFSQRSRAFGHGHFGVGPRFFVCGAPVCDG